MTRILWVVAVVAGLAFGGLTPALAQSSGGEGVSMQTLLKRGYEIKAAAPNGAQYVVFLQKGNSAYACEFVTITNSRCGSINKEAQ